jgi:hypothetical protein
MKVMCRVRFQNVEDIEAAYEHLSAAGFETCICWGVICLIDSSITVETVKSFEGDVDVGSVLDEVDAIVEPYDGLCMETLPVPDDYVPHADEDNSPMMPDFERARANRIAKSKRSRIRIVKSETVEGK